MNKALIAVAIVVLFSSTAFSKEKRDPFEKPQEASCTHPKNPDCMPSFGLSVDLNSLTGSGTVSSITGVKELSVGDSLSLGSESVETWEKTGEAKLDIILPISNTTTVTGNISYESHSGQLGVNFQNEGAGFGVGFRHYFK